MIFLLTQNDEIKHTLQVGLLYQGGIIVQVDETGEHGIVMSRTDLGDGNWQHAVDLC